MRKLLRNDTSIRVISVLISILLWVYVVGVNNPTVSVILRGINVERINTELFNSTGLKIISVSNEKIDVKVEGRHSEVSKITATDIKAHIDISEIKRAGTYECDIVIEPADSAVKYTNTTADKATIFADSVVAVNKDVVIEINGAPKEGFTVESVKPADAKVLVRGPKSIVGTVSKVVAYVDVNGVDSNISKNMPLKAINASGKEVDMTYVTTNITETLIEVKLTQTKEVEINPVVSETEMQTGYSVKITPEKIKIKGDESIVKSLSKIDTEPIEITEENVPEKGETKKLPATLVLPEGISLADDKPVKIEVIVSSVEQ